MGGANGESQPVKMLRNDRLKAEVIKRRKDLIVIMNFRSVDGKIMVPHDYEVTRVLTAKGVINEEWGGISLKPKEAEIMVKSMDTAKWTLFEHLPMKSSYYLPAVWI